MRKALSLFMVIFAIITATFIIGPSVFAARTSGDFEFEAIDGGTICITDYIGSSEVVKIPETIDGYTVTEIRSSAFQNCYGITKIEIPESVTDIGYDVFNGTAFYNDEKNWDNGILYIDNCLIATKPQLITGKITVKQGTRVIAARAFCECEHMTEIKLPEGLLTVGYSAFFRCSSLEELIFPDSVTRIEHLDIVDTDSLYRNTSQLKRVVLGDGLTEITYNMFSGCENLTEVVIGENVTKIGREAFCNTAIKSITIPDSVTDIEYRAFWGCDFLSTVELGSGIQKIDSSAFDSSNISEVTYNGNALQWDSIEIKDHNDKIKELVQVLKDDTEITDAYDEAVTDTDSKDNNHFVVPIIVIVIIVLVGLTIFMLRKNKREKKNI